MNAATNYVGGMVKYDVEGQSRGLHAIDSEEGKLAAWGGSDTKA